MSTYKTKKILKLQRAEKLAKTVMEKICKMYPMITADFFASYMILAGATQEDIALTSAKAFRMARINKMIVRGTGYILSDRIYKRKAPMVKWNSLIYESPAPKSK